MLSDPELEALLQDLESDRVERKESLADPARIRQAICAFGNDMPNHRKPGVVFVGVRDNGDCARLPITDLLLRTLADMRSDGNILPFPIMTVRKKTIVGCELAVVEVEPSDAPPVRFNGRVWIRVGPRRATATAEEERRLNEKRRSKDLPYDLHVVESATLNDLDTHYFAGSYLPAALPPEVLDANERALEQQLASLRFVGVDGPHHPTAAGLLVLGKAPADFIPGAYIQFLRLDGTELTSPIRDQKELHGHLGDVLRRLDDVLSANISVATDISSGVTEARHPDYPLVSLQQFSRNGVMHRDYQTTNAPVRFT
jgi:ATP-dependent DNA helicase RecG